MFQIKSMLAERVRDQSLALMLIYLDARKAARHETSVRIAANM